MSSIQIGALIYFTLIAVGAWIFFAVIFIQLERFVHMSCYIPLISRILTILLIILTIGGYVMIFYPSFLDGFGGGTKIPEKTNGYFDTY